MTGLALGAPGVYRAVRPRDSSLSRIRLDVTGFAGVAPRGPTDVPVPVESWSEFRWLYGGTEGPGLLGQAVRAFFAQGGHRAVVCRVSPLPRADGIDARALLRLSVGGATETGALVPRSVALLAASEGSWGSLLEVEFDFIASSHVATQITGAQIDVPAGWAPPVGSTVRLRGDGLPADGVLTWIESLDVVSDDRGHRRRVALLDRGHTPAGRAQACEAEIVTLTVRVRDRDPLLVRTEAFENLGLRSTHPRSVHTVLHDESRLVTPAADWPDSILPPTIYLGGVLSKCERAGVDRWEAIGYGSLFGDQPVTELPTDVDDVDDEHPDCFGVDLLSLVPELGLLCVPDLFWDHVDPVDPTVASARTWQARFAPCEPPEVELSMTVLPVRGSRLDARTQPAPVQERQARLVDLADRQQRFVALLDVPEHLSLAAISRWRAQFTSSFAAAYHPWLGVPGERAGDPVHLVPPSAFAAGIIADREQRLGLPWGPANALAAGAVVSAISIDDAAHATLHAQDIDVFRAERDGFRLTSAHTLARDPQYRQLSVRRLMTMLRLVLARQCQWLAFEPNTEMLRRQVTRTVTQLLRDLYRDGALAGRSEDEAFFVRCDEGTNPRVSIEQGRLVTEVGVCPATPLEYLVLRIAQDTEGQLQVVAPT